MSQIFSNYMRNLLVNVSILKNPQSILVVTRVGGKDMIKSMLGVKEVEKFESYLGLPTLLDRSKYQAFSFLKDGV